MVFSHHNFQLRSIYIQINNRESSEFGENQRLVYFQMESISSAKNNRKKEVCIYV